MVHPRRRRICWLACTALWAVAFPTFVYSSPSTGTFLDRSGADVRVVSFNVNWDSIFTYSNPTRAAGFSRLAAAIAPDVWAFQELGTAPVGQSGSTAADLKNLLDAVQPIPNGWNVFKANELALVSRWPLAKQVGNITPTGYKRVSAALVDLPDAEFPVDLYVINAHYRCCGGTTNDPFRQIDSDAIVSWMRDARTPGGSVELPYATPMIALGDLNLVGGQQPLSTLVSGDIQNSARYGADSPPDWDAGPNEVLNATHNGAAGGETYTWRNDLDVFAPGRLDYMVYTDSMLSPSKGFVLNTAAMSPEDLAATGLQPFDSLYDGSRGYYDHLPLVMDFRIQPSASLAIRIDVTTGTVTQSQAGFIAIPLAPSLSKTGSGCLVLNGPNTLTGPTTIQQGTLQLADASALVTSAISPLAGGVLSLTPYLRATVGGLNPNAGGLVDVGNGMVTVANGLTQLGLVTALQSGRAGGSWTGSSGVTSSGAASAMASSTLRSVGWLDNGNRSMTFAYAATGDSNLDWTVDILDAGNFLTFGKFDTGLPADWLEGDFNYDNVVDVLDAADFFATSLYDAGPYNTPAGSVAAVPEPSTLGLVGIGVLGLMAVRRKRAI
jgi:autotransporter-associated beta strand protein